MTKKKADNELSMSGIEVSSLNSYVRRGKEQYAFDDYQNWQQDAAEYDWYRNKSPASHAPKISQQLATMEREEYEFEE